MVRNKALEKTKSSLPDRVKEIEDEISRTKYNKRTQGHVGLLKAKLAQLKEKQITRRKGKGKTEGYSVKKSGDGTVIIVGFPSVGKSTLLNKISNAKSQVGAYAFTTLTCIPGMLNYKGAKIQVLDVPGVVRGAASGKGRGKEVLSVAMNSDLVLFVIDVHSPEHYPILLKEIRDSYLRINEVKPDVRIKKKSRGGIGIGTTVKLTHLDKPTIKKMLNEFRITNADVLIRSNINPDQLIDIIEGNKKYISGIVVFNKVDIATPAQIAQAKKIIKPDLLISAEKGEGIDELKELIFQRLGFMRVFCKRQGQRADMGEPLIMRRGDGLKEMCEKLHRDFVTRFRFARIWGSSKFPGQAIRKMSYPLKDQDVVELILD
ncbi:GTP-binding protein [Candidatus Woesearchaeota archaeon]|nr:GTP-binding protein [Candidatus Woesearchaeota archaeon]